MSFTAVWKAEEKLAKSCVPLHCTRCFFITYQQLHLKLMRCHANLVFFVDRTFDVWFLLVMWKPNIFHNRLSIRWNQFFTDNRNERRTGQAYAKSHVGVSW